MWHPPSSPRLAGIPSPRRHPLSLTAVAAIAAALALVFGAGPALANVPLTQLSSDPFTNTTSQHRTQVEPDTFSFGNTIVSAFQTGRFFDGGSSDICFATSTNGGSSWTNGCLPGVTKFQNGGAFDRASDPAVTFDSRHNVWMISTLAITDTSGVLGKAVVTSRSTDGGLTWGAPVTTATATGSANLDKNWIGCDNSAASAFFGTCYTEFDDNGAGNAIKMARSTNGGTSWTVVSTSATGLGGQPVVRPNGTVLVPYESNNGQIRSFRSVDGGVSWRATVLVATIQDHTVAGSLRTEPLPSAEIDSAGTAYVVWQDCRFRSGCPSNDIVLSKSTSETTWGAVTRVTSDAGDHFIPGVGVDTTTSGGTARVAVTYYRYPTANCTAATCQLTVGYTSSTNGGTSWSAPTQLAGPMTLSWLPNTSQGRMVGDYISTSIVGGRAWPVFEVATAPTGSTFSQNSNTPTGGLAIGGGARSAMATPVVTSGHQPSHPRPPRIR
ncbi:exo-alpha-sialidase [Actinomadura barringtoniae]|uniref:Exo-alpha-sialidase n=1 Tax=Actinomadura barringtoniae TaxID=1427535 RepID=A0A939P8P0_9ACTN|nr:sialidase family protein [Actinomadura barringtoniae]MBO2447778.1 exo-alpha-sialidase [Actinomadura barringtoniae]